jgi:hypothetical protein
LAIARHNQPQRLRRPPLLLRLAERLGECFE